MKVCVVRRDGKDVDDVMTQMVITVGEESFGNIDVYVGFANTGTSTIIVPNNQSEPTQYVSFHIPDTTASAKIVHFISEISRINPFYTVRLIDNKPNSEKSEESE